MTMMIRFVTLDPFLLAIVLPVGHNSLPPALDHPLHFCDV